MADVIEEKVEDTHLEHDAYHQEYHNDCSSCFVERNMARARSARLREELGFGQSNRQIDDPQWTTNPFRD